MEYGFRRKQGITYREVGFLCCLCNSCLNSMHLKIKTNDVKDITAPSGQRGQGRNLNAR